MAVEFMTGGSVSETLDRVEASFGERVSLLGFVNAAFQLFVVNFQLWSSRRSRDLAQVAGNEQPSWMV